MHTLYLKGFGGDEHLPSTLWPEPDENTQPVSIKPYVDADNFLLHFIHDINNPHGLKTTWPVDLVIQ